MKNQQMKKLYIYINVPFIIIFLILSIVPFAAIYNKNIVYYIGILARVLLGIWCIFNGVWNAFTDHYSFFKNNKVLKTNKLSRGLWLLVCILGIICIITAFMGYGFNGIRKY